jgi:TonB family protein
MVTQQKVSCKLRWMIEEELPKRDSQNRTATVREKAASFARHLYASLAAKFDHLLNHVSGFAAALQRFKPSRWRVLSSVFAIALNVVMIAVVAASLNPPSSHDANELHLVLAPSTRSQATIPTPPDVEMPVLQMPDIVIARDEPDTAPSALAASLVLAPRPDPDHPNPSFIVEQKLPSGSVILKILVSADGNVVDATVQMTSGMPEVDRSAIAFVEARWKFLPALLEDRPIQYWTTVTVRLA